MGHAKNTRLGWIALTAVGFCLFLPRMAQGLLPAAHLQTRYLQIHYPAGEERAAQALAQSADLLCAKVLADLGSTPTHRVRVALATDLAQMQAFAPTGVRVASWMAGLAIQGENLILLRIRTASAGPDPLERVFLHEWAHLALAQAVAGRPLPHWFQEGFAMLESGDWSFDRARTLAAGVLAQRLFSLEALGETFPQKLGDIELAYAQSIDFIGFLQATYGRTAFHRLLELLTQGEPFLDALEEACDEGLFAIEDEWRRQLRVRFTWIPVLTGAGTVWFFASLVFLAAYLRKSRKKRAAIAQMEDNPADDLLEWEEDPPLEAHLEDERG